MTDEKEVTEHVNQRLLKLESSLESFDELPLVALLRTQLQQFVVVRPGAQPEEDMVAQSNR